MNAYAHTADDERGLPLPVESGKWQPLAEHLRNVADSAARFAAPFGAAHLMVGSRLVMPRKSFAKLLKEPLNLSCDPTISSTFNAGFGRAAVTPQ